MGHPGPALRVSPSALSDRRSSYPPVAKTMAALVSTVGQPPDKASLRNVCEADCPSKVEAGAEALTTRLL